MSDPVSDPVSESGPRDATPADGGEALVDGTVVATDADADGGGDGDDGASEDAQAAGGGSGEGEATGDATGDEQPPGAPPGPDYRMTIVSAVTLELPAQYPMVVLRETESPRRQLSFAIGLPDGTALAHALRRVPTPRPLTHELVTSLLQGFDIDLVAVRLVGRHGGTYFAELDLRGRSDRRVYSCRPSDALALALRQPVPVPILVDDRLFDPDGDVDPPA